MNVQQLPYLHYLKPIALNAEAHVAVGELHAVHLRWVVVILRTRVEREHFLERGKLFGCKLFS